MPRRSFGISATQINRLISAHSALAKERERVALINSQRGIKTEMDPEYSIEGFDFNKTSRVSHIQFLETTKYRKIEKYVTNQGKRYPIYGGWNTKTKTIKKTIKLTNDALEKLNSNEDHLISSFSYEIVAKIGNEDFYPSWFIIQTLKDNEQEEHNDISRLYEEKREIIKEESSKIERKIEKRKETIEKRERELQKFNVKEKRLNSRISRIENREHFFFFSVLTLGIYVIACSKNRLLRLKSEHGTIVSNIKSLEQDISYAEQDNENDRKLVRQKLDLIPPLMNEMQIKQEAIKKKYESLINQVELLPTDLSMDSEKGFIPLKQLSGMNYQKIVGCYIIHNKENNKYYVGQSKDVFKRICRQHFDGTKVKNIIFAEDYFNSQFPNKDDLFEVKIIPLETKDELDQKEKDLIEEYDSFANGYNGTSGNR